MGRVAGLPQGPPASGCGGAHASQDGEDYLHAAARQSGGLLLNEDRATSAKPFPATLKSRALLTDASTGVEDKFHVVIDVSRAGALLGAPPRPPAPGAHSPPLPVRFAQPTSPGTRWGC
jgi:hypothetical protein